MIVSVGLLTPITQASILDELKTDLRFQKLPLQSKLSNLNITDIAEDSLGLIWIATSDGLNRYDGHSNRIYRSSKQNPNSLSNSNITCLLIDKNGSLWVGTKNGLNRYNKEKDIFVEPISTLSAKTKLSDTNIRSIFQDSIGRIWVSTDDGNVILINQDEMQSEIVPIFNNQNNRFYPRKFIETENKTILLASNVGLLEFNESAKHFENINKQNEQASHFSKNSMVMVRQKDNQLLIGTNRGLYLLQLYTNQYVSILPEYLESERITTINKLDSGEILIGTQTSGIFLVNDSLKLIKHHKTSTEKYSILNNLITTVFESKEKQLWIGTNLGISIADQKNQQFHHIQKKLDTTKLNCITGETIFAILADSQDLVWVAFFGKELKLIDLKNNLCAPLPNIENIETSQFENVVALYEDEVSDIWIGTFDNGVIRYLRSENRFEKINPKQFPEETIRLKYITSIKGDGNGRIWFGTQSEGLIELNTNENKLKKFIPKLQPSNIGVANIQDIELGDDSHLWLASESNGLWKFNLQSHEFEHITMSSLDKKNIPKSLMSLTLDIKNNLWIGTNGDGVIRLDYKAEKSKHYTVENGLLNNVVMNISQDNQENMWFMTDKGLSRLSATTKKIHTFLEKDGLQADAFTRAGFFDKKNNTLYTGGINGFNYFNPDKIKIDSDSNAPIISKFELFYKPVEISNSNQETPLKQTIQLTKQLDLNHNQNVFAFSFSALEFISPEQIQYQFKLEGYDKSWNSVDSDRRYANYTNIDPGNYIFKVKSSNQFGEWNDKETSLIINIAFPWWQTNLAYATYLLLLLSSIYLIVTLRTKALVNRSKQLENSVIERTKELASEKNKVEQLLSRKNEEFANVSHEFRTPLTLILGPLAQLLKSADKSEDITRLNVVQRNGYRLLRMVDQLLNLETFRVKAITQKIPQATGKTIRLLTEAFADLAQEKNIRMSIGKIAEVNFAFTPDALEKIILNLLSNAIKYTKSGGSISIETKRSQNNELVIRVEDTGIGIPADKIDAIFERYNRVLDENSEQVTGAGIGLALVKSLVESHQGYIRIKSQLGKGTEICVTLPISGEVEADQVKLHNNDEIIAMELMSLTNQNLVNNPEITAVSPNNLSDKPMLLVIEDNQDMRNYIVDSIKDDYQILTAKDGEEGVQIATAEVPDLIISDVMMPKMDGYQVTHELRQNPLTNHIPIILLTARGDRESRLKGWFNKADEYLTKPFDSVELKIRLNNLLEIRNILKKRFAEKAFQIDLNSAEIIEQEPTETEIETSRNIPQEIFVAKFNNIIEQIYAESNLSVADIAFKINMSERQLFRKLKSILDMTPAEYLKRFRLEKAKALLAQGHSVSYATFEVGFANQSNFAKCFKAQYDLSPSEYKKNHS